MTILVESVVKSNGLIRVLQPISYLNFQEICVIF